jgi:flagellar biosynthetic protein FlhB
MSEGPDAESQTEEPSQRKLDEARRRGQVPLSREVNSWFLLLAATGMLLFVAPPASRSLATGLAAFMEPQRFLGADGILWEAVTANLGRLLWVLLVPLGVLAAAAAGGTLMQIGLVFAPEKLHFDIGNLSPMKGLGRLFSLRALLEFGKNLLKVAVVGAVLWWLMRPELDGLPLLANAPVEATRADTYRLMLRLAFGVVVITTVLALADYLYQRISFRRSMRMTKEEVKEEYRQQEGDPHIKSKLRQLRAERARRRMMAAVPEAAVVVTNPTHFAVALKYEMGAMGAPRVVAKGADLVAQRIREVAKEHGVPLVENPPLARTLYATVELDHEIPPEHYKAVAEVISFVLRAKNRANRR